MGSKADMANFAFISRLFKSIYVTFEITISYKDGKACFRIDQEGEGIYTAHLVSWEGSASNHPPKKITFIKVVRCWSGSIDDEILVNVLGRCIDTRKQQNATVKNKVHQPSA